LNSSERDEWTVKLEESLLIGGASFSEWATLMSHEAHTCFVAGADIATVILCASTCETYLRSETSDFGSSFFELIEQYDFREELRADLHTLRLARNRWVHLREERHNDVPESYEMGYTLEIEASAKHSYETMLRVLFSNPWV
jgi:hypothetical protein